MAFNWVISQLDSIPTLDGMDKVISVIHYRAQKVFEYFPNPNLKMPETGIVDTYGALSVDAPHESSFTPYDDVTKAMVEGWLSDALDPESIEANLDAKIENFLNPPLVAYPLPFNN